ncbi:MAG: hypothetical protein OXN44_01300 [Acidimicrobiaceae bacterium]|nr:hypothetical protein [Acidimicrobiaceae bacterium]
MTPANDPREPPVDFVDLILQAHESLKGADLPHAFGGALALAWCVGEPRATNDIDVNVFVPAAQFRQVLATLPSEIEASPRALAQLERDGQARLWWNRVPFDVFLTSDPFHEAVADRIVLREFAGRSVPFLACVDLAVFKAFFDRSKDWQDIEEMVNAEAVALPVLEGELIELLGEDDQRVTRLRSLNRQRG